MTKTEFVAGIAEKLDMSKKDVARVIDEAFSLIEDTLAQGEKCVFIGFGTFETRERAAREGRNPQDPTKVIKIPARRAPVFRPGKDLKERVMQ